MELREDAVEAVVLVSTSRGPDVRLHLGGLIVAIRSGNNKDEVNVCGQEYGHLLGVQ